MKKVIMLLTVVTVLTTSIYAEKFESFTLSNRYICLPYEQMDKLIIAYKLVPVLQSQTNALTVYTETLKAMNGDNKKTIKQEKVKSFFKGMIAGAGVVLFAGIAITTL